MKSKLKIYTSYVTPENLSAVVESGLLPVFILRHIHRSETIGKYSGTALHMRDLAPSDELYQSYRDGRVGWEEYEKRYIIEHSGIRLEGIVKKLEYMASLIDTCSGVVLMGYGESLLSHRRVLAGLLDFSGLLENPVIEWKYGARN